MGRESPTPTVGGWVTQARAFTSRYVRQMGRSKLGIAFLVAWPTVWYVLMVRLFFPPGTDAAVAKAAYAVGFGLFGSLTVALNGVVGSFALDVGTRRYRTFRSLGVSPSADLVGRLVAGFVFSAVAYASLLVVGYLDGAAFALRAPASVPVVAGSLLAFSSVGVVAALCVTALVPRPEHATAVATIALLVALFLTGFNGTNAAVFPGPGWLLNYLPLTLATRVQLYHLVDAPFAASRAFTPPPMPAGPGAVALLFGYGVGAVAVGARVMAALVYRRELGE